LTRAMSSLLPEAETKPSTWHKVTIQVRVQVKGLQDKTIDHLVRFPVPFSWNHTGWKKWSQVDSLVSKGKAFRRKWKKRDWKQGKKQQKHVWSPHVLGFLKLEPTDGPLVWGEFHAILERGNMLLTHSSEFLISWRAWSICSVKPIFLPAPWGP